MDDEDDDILDDIKALEFALANDTQLLVYENEDEDESEIEEIEEIEKIEELNCIPPPENIKSSTSESNNQSNDLYDTIDSVVKTNVCLLEAYKSALNVVNTRLDECIKRQHEVDYQIQLISRGGKANWRVPYFKAGQPYFKDENLFYATPNDDQLIKQRRDEFPIVYARLPSKWSPKGRANLWKAARANASLKYLDMMKSINRNNVATSNTNNLIPSDFLDILKTLGDTELDWMKISVKDLNSRHSWQACKAMWDLHMNPMNNRKKWGKNEDNRLTLLAKFYKYQNWNLIAEKLGTRRTCYQCFVRYNTINPPSTTNVNADAPWSPAEDELVINLVSELRIGDIIPWSLVTFYLGNRTKNQIYCHWKYNLDPTLKKGRFTADEDQTLLNAVNKYGENFPRIASECFSQRTSVQLSSRFHLLMLKTNESYNSWTIAEDKRLLGLYDEFGNNWSVIGNIMNKDRTYVRHHHAALTRHLSKGTDLIAIPRKPNSTTAYDNNRIDESETDEMVGENIDVKLIRYFQDLPKQISRPGRKRKFHTAEQLETKTKQLQDIFEKLSVNIDIPDNLDDFNELTPMDKQLLLSYKQSVNKKTPKYTPEKIEEYRRKMFCTDKLDDNTEQFIPPAPFGLFQNIRKRGRSKSINGSTVCNNCNIELVMELDTPKNIIEGLSENELKLFDKLTLLITKNCEVKKYPEKFIEEHVKSTTMSCSLSGENVNNSQPGNSKSYSTNDNSTNIMNGPFIKPSYSTLLGYQCLLNMQKQMENSLSDDLSIDESAFSKEGKQALRLLKKRCATLFKYPIGMARIPIKYEEFKDNDDEHDKEDEEDDEDEEDEDIAVIENLSETTTVECESETSELTMKDVEVTTPMRLSLNMVKTLRGKKRDKIKTSAISENEL